MEIIEQQTIMVSELWVDDRLIKQNNNNNITVIIVRQVRV